MIWAEHENHRAGISVPHTAAIGHGPAKEGGLPDRAQLAPMPPKNAPSTRPLPAGVDESKGQTGYSRLQQLLREDIIAGRIAEGARLKVSDIAARYGTSTNPAREALQGLEGEGLVVITPNCGARVRAVDEDFLRNIFDLRSLIEPYLVRGFVEFAAAEDVQAIAALQQACADAVAAGDYTMFHACNVSFHDFILNHHHNAEAVQVMKQHGAWIRSLARKNPLTPSQMRRSSDEHWELVEALRRGDPDAGAAAISKHIGHSREIVLGHMRRAQARRPADPA